MRQVDIDWNIALFKAAREGDYKAALAAIDNGASVKVKEVGKHIQTTSKHKTGLYNPEVYQKSKWEIKDTTVENFEYNYTPLHWAVYKLYETETSNHQAVAQLLIDNGADVNAQDHMGQTPLHWAIRAENYDLVKLLIDNGAEVNAQDHMGQTPLDFCIRANELKIAKLLMLNCADKIHKDTLTFLNAEDQNGHTYLDNALIQAANKDIDITCYIELAIKLGLKFSDPQYALNFASSYGLANLATHILDNYEIDINERDDDNGDTALYYAIISNHLEIAKLLREKGATVMDAQDALFNTAKAGFKEAVEYILDNYTDLDIDKEDTNGCSAFEYAIISNHLEIAKLLRERGADTAIYSQDALFDTAASGFKEAVEYILYNYTDLDINEKDDSGYTALDYAINNGKLHTALLLVKNGASVCNYNNNIDQFEQFHSSYIQSMRIGAFASLTAAGLLYAISNDYRYNLAATAVFGVISAYSSTSVKSKTYATAFAYSASSAIYMIASESEELAMVCTISSAALALGTFCYSMYTCTQHTIQLNEPDLSSM